MFKLFDLLDKNGVHAVIEDLMNIPNDISLHLRGLFDILDNFIYASAILKNFLRRCKSSLLLLDFGITLSKQTLEKVKWTKGQMFLLYPQWPKCLSMSQDKI